MSQSHEQYQKVAHELRVQFEHATHRELMQFSLDTFRGFMPPENIQDGGGTLGPIAPIVAPETQHTFNNPERFFLVTQATDLMDRVAVKGTQLDINDTQVDVAPLRLDLQNRISASRPDRQIIINRLSSQAMYRTLIATVLKYPYTAPAFSALLSVAGHDGISLAGTNLINFAGLSLESNPSTPFGYWRTNHTVTEALQKVPNAPELFPEMLAQLSRDGKLSESFKVKYAQDFPKAFPLIKTFAGFMQEVGPALDDVIRLDQISTLSGNYFLDGTKALINSPDLEKKRQGIACIRLVMNLYQFAMNDDIKFWRLHPLNQHVPREETFEVVCIGRAVAKRIHDFGAEAFTDFAAGEILNGAQNPCRRMVTTVEPYPDRDAIQNFLLRLGQYAEFSLPKDVPLQNLALEALRDVRPMPEGVVDVAIKSFI